MKQFVVIFNKPIVLPGDNLEKIRTYGIFFDKSEIATFDRISNYIRNYILAVAELFKEGIEHIDERSFQRNGEVFYVNGPTWQEYIKKAEKKKIRFAVLDEEDIMNMEEYLNENYLLTDKDKWKQLKGMSKVVWY